MDRKFVTYNEFIRRCNRLTFDRNGKPVHTKQFKKFYIRYAHELLEDYGLDMFRCNNPKCGISDWFGAKILKHGELHHINGITHDSRFKNLKVYCSNCHILTRGYKNRTVEKEMLIEIEYGKKIFL